MSDTEASRSANDLAPLIEVLARQAEISAKTLEMIELRALPLLERIAVALERAPVVTSPGTRSNTSGRDVADFRQAIAESRWDQAEAVVAELSQARPGDAEVLALADELNRTRQFAVDDIRQRIEAARQANDPDGAINARDELALILRGEALHGDDRLLVKWLISLVQRRLRTGTVRADVVALASRIAESFGGTTEGASLRASLPTLRRSAGLCPKCAEPYAGVGDACPKCLAASAAPAPPLEPIPVAGSEEEDPDLEVTTEPVDLNNERFWQIP